MSGVNSRSVIRLSTRRVLRSPSCRLYFAHTFSTMYLTGMTNPISILTDVLMMKLSIHERTVKCPDVPVPTSDRKKLSVMTIYMIILRLTLFLASLALRACSSALSSISSVRFLSSISYPSQYTVKNKHYNIITLSAIRPHILQPFLQLYPFCPYHEAKQLEKKGFRMNYPEAFDRSVSCRLT